MPFCFLSNWIFFLLPSVLIPLLVLLRNSFKFHIRSCPSFAQNSPIAPSSLRIKAKALTMALYTTWSPSPLWSSTFPVTHCSPTTLCSLSMSGTPRLPTSEPLYLLVSHLEYASSQIIWWLTQSLPVCSNVTSLEKHSLTDISKIAPFTSTFYTLILLYVIFFYKSLMTTWYIIFIYCDQCLSLHNRL